MMLSQAIDMSSKRTSALLDRTDKAIAKLKIDFLEEHQKALKTLQDSIVSSLESNEDELSEGVRSALEAKIEKVKAVFEVALGKGIELETPRTHLCDDEDKEDKEDKGTEAKQK